MKRVRKEIAALLKQRESRRLAKRARRRARKQRRSRLKREQRLETFLTQYAMLAGLKPLESRRTTEHLHFPRVFSLIDDPVQSIKALNELARLSLGAKCTHVRIDQSECSHIDHGAASIANVMAQCANRYHGVTIEGTLPSDPVLAEIVAATGLPHALGIDMDAKLSDFKRFELRCGRRRETDAHQSTDFDLYSAEFADYINECLVVNGLRLSEEGVEYLIRLLTEVIENVERHSGTDQWWIGGYMRQPEGEIGVCYLCIFNLGKSVYESLSSLPEGARLREEIEALVLEHGRKGFLGGGAWAGETLWTLYAMQEGVSRMNDQEQHLGTNGVGTVEMMEFFQKLTGATASHRPMMCLVSGSSYILLDGTFKMQEQETSGGGRRRVIAFNAENSLRQKPSRRHVRSLPVRFPGTVISMRFHLEAGNLVAGGAPYVE